ncbi:mechanosensitive ion channel family protein [Sneathiella glossodoripedis]|uniref:mechanosensitive ion channel family protein n=1 Tax=Sneathiella glossodoripedis TaxID=418853 RepID=UPI000470FAB7|nr:mechanosensitive ion channel family protein [Sneathiella glossodoripedis]
MMDGLEENLETVNKWLDLLVEFAIKYGFQILGALAFLLVGMMVSNWIGTRLTKLAIARGIDQTLSQFIGSTIKFVLLILLIIITLGNFGISIAPLIALAGAVSLGATLALQGPISNFGAGVAIILTRPFVVGNVITVLGVSGVVNKITLGITFLTGEDGEEISIPNKEIVGQVIVNSHDTRILETSFSVSAETDTQALIQGILEILADHPDIPNEPEPQVGIHDFTYGGYVIGLRSWVPGQKYFQVRYDINHKIQQLLDKTGVELLTPSGLAIAMPAPGKAPSVHMGSGAGADGTST